MLLGLAFLVMWPFSYWRYTSFGVDVDRAEGAAILQTHYRLRWPGNGAFLMGADVFRRLGPGPLDRFDLGGAFFRAPRKPPERSVWNRMGFWLISDESQGGADTARDAVKVRSFWVGVPSWVPPLLLGLLPARWWIRRRRHMMPPRSTWRGMTTHTVVGFLRMKSGQ